MDQNELMAVQLVKDVLATTGAWPAAMVDDEGVRTERTPYQDGWNAAFFEISKRIREAFSKLQIGIDKNLAFLLLAGVGYTEDGKFYLNMNDTFHFACSDSEIVSKEEAKEVARLFKTYGGRGIDYWVAQKRGYDPEIPKYKQGVEEVRNKEASISLCPSCWPLFNEGEK